MLGSPRGAEAIPAIWKVPRECVDLARAASPRKTWRRIWPWPSSAVLKFWEREHGTLQPLASNGVNTPPSVSMPTDSRSVPSRETAAVPGSTRTDAPSVGAQPKRNNAISPGQYLTLPPYHLMGEPAALANGCLGSEADINTATARFGRAASWPNQSSQHRGRKALWPSPTSPAARRRATSRACDVLRVLCVKLVTTPGIL